MVVKVKEPVEKEYGFFREGLVLFTYLHLAPIPDLTGKLLDKKVTGIAYETIHDKADAAAAHPYVRGRRAHVRPSRRGLS